MPTVNAVKICPKCEKLLHDPNQMKCFYCHTLLKTPNSDFFGVPDYLTRQYSEAILETKRDGKVKEGQELSSEVSQKINEIRAQYQEWIMHMPYEDRIASMRDALTLMQHLIVGNASLKEVGELLKLGKRIGEISDAIEGYLKAHGHIANFAHLELPVPEKEVDESDKI